MGTTASPLPGTQCGGKVIKSSFLYGKGAMYDILALLSVLDVVLCSLLRRVLSSPLLHRGRSAKSRLTRHSSPKTPETRASCAYRLATGSFANEPAGPAQDANAGDDGIPWGSSKVVDHRAPRSTFVIGRKAPCCASDTLVTKLAVL